MVRPPWSSQLAQCPSRFLPPSSMPTRPSSSLLVSSIYQHGVCYDEPDTQRQLAPRLSSKLKVCAIGFLPKQGVGLSTIICIASLALAEASEAIGTATQLTPVVTSTSTQVSFEVYQCMLTPIIAINSTPVVKVSSIGGNQEITLATGTAGATTIFGGEVFTAVPK